MIEQMLLYAGLRSGRRKFDIEPVSIHDAVRAALADAGPVLEEQGFTVESEIATDLPAAQADRRALAQVLQNLILNALKYSGSSRWLGIRACAVREGGEWEIRLTVEDRGSGIGAEDLPHIFEPFYRGKNALAAGVTGSGLGLSMVQQSVDAMGGRITASSAPGRGSSFTLHLRALPNPQAAGACAPDEGSLGEAKDPVH